MVGLRGEPHSAISPEKERGADRREDKLSRTTDQDGENDQYHTVLCNFTGLFMISPAGHLKLFHHIKMTGKKF